LHEPLDASPWKSPRLRVIAGIADGGARSCDDVAEGEQKQLQIPAIPRDFGDLGDFPG